MAEEKAAARLAVLIDAENVPQWAVTPLLTEIARHGTPQVRRAYGDWTSAALHGRKQTLLTHAIRPVQVFAAVKGKNAADIAVVIDAMDLLHSGTVDAFHLVSSDSDFARLAERIREAGRTVHGYGEQHKTNPGLVAACDTFVFIETLTPVPPAAPALAAAVPAEPAAPSSTATAPAIPAQDGPECPPPATPTTAPGPGGSAATAGRSRSAGAIPTAKKEKAPGTATTTPATRMTSAQLRADVALVRRLRDAVTTGAGPDGWTHLATVGQNIRKHPAIVLRTYGYSRLKDLIAATELFEIQQRAPDGSGAIYSRVK